MPDTILQTKLNIPPLRPGLIPRPRLIDGIREVLVQLSEK
jgi:hypothetical protein